MLKYIVLLQWGVACMLFVYLNDFGSKSAGYKISTD